MCVSAAGIGGYVVGTVYLKRYSALVYFSMSWTSIIPHKAYTYHNFIINFKATHDQYMIYSCRFSSGTFTEQGFHRIFSHKYWLIDFIFNFPNFMNHLDLIALAQWIKIMRITLMVAFDSRVFAWQHHNKNKNNIWNKIFTWYTYAYTQSGMYEWELSKAKNKEQKHKQ